MTRPIEPMPPVVVVGAGAIGLYLAAHLSKVTDVTLVARGPRAAALSERGFDLAGADTGTYRLPVHTLSPDYALDPAAIVMIAVKATDLEKLVGPLAAFLHPGQTVVLIQNGLGVQRFARNYLADVALVRVTCWVGVTLEDGRRAVVAGAPLFEAGTDDDAGAAALPALLMLLNAANLRARSVGTAAEVEWRKALLNLAVSGVCAIVEERNGAILDSPELRAIVRDVISEAIPVAAAEGVTLGEHDIARVYAALRNTAENWNAMFQDLRRGAATEMPYLNAAVARLARRHGLHTPVNTTVARFVGHIGRRRSREAISGDEGGRPAGQATFFLD